jgi:hypothetical protein
MYCIWIRSSRRPVEYFGAEDSDDLGSMNLLGSFVPRSTAGQPYSVKRIGFDPGNHGVGTA